MKFFTILPMILLIGLIACSKPYIKPDVKCPSPAPPVLEITDDKSILDCLNKVIGYSEELKSTIKCYEESLK
jgi:hypothetical protein